MVDSSIHSATPALTRLARACALLAAQGAAVGFAIDTARLWSRLGTFAANNKMPHVERAQVLGVLLLPAVLWVGLCLLVSLWRRCEESRLTFLERLSYRGAWVIALGALPLLLHPTLWKSRALMFQMVTATATLVMWWGVRVMPNGRRTRVERVSQPTDLRRIGWYVVTITPPKLKVLAPVLVIGVMVLYVLARGIWLDPAVHASAPSEPPLSVHSLRQAFQIQGHGGWLGVPFVMLKFLRPPGQAHTLFMALCVAAAAFPLYFWAKPRLGTLSALLVALIYLTMPALRTLGRNDVFPIGIAAGLFFLATAAWEKNRLKEALILTLLTIGVNEQTALWFTCYGWYWGGTHGRGNMGRWLAIGGVVYFCLVAFVVLPELGLDPYRTAFKGIWGHKPVGLIETLHVSFTNPGYVLTRWVDLQTLAFWMAILVPFAFLPVTSRYWLLWMMPGIVFGIVGLGRAPEGPPTAGVLGHFIVLGFAASVTTLAHVRSDPARRHHASAAVVAWVFAAVPCVYQLGGLLRPPL